MTDFSMLGLNPSLLAAVARMGIADPTPIQARAIPSVMEGRDLMGLAQTGTGKTLAFGLPLMHRLDGQGRPAPKTVRSLILAPTRELVSQIADTLTKLAEGGPLKVVTVVGGASLNRQSDRLARGCDVLVATPGRLIDLLERHALTLGQVQVLVLDEADQMLDMGFIHALRKIARHLPEKRQTLLFSATMPKDMSEIADTYLDRPVRVQVAPPGKAADKIEQAVHFGAQGDTAKLLESWGFSVGSIHGNKSQGQRERTLAAFRAGEIKVLVATDVAARGLDIPLVAHVYNFDLPNVPENYIHRIGRTARAGREGRAMAFCAPAEMADLRAIEKLTRTPIAVEGGEPWPESMAEEARTLARKANGQGRGQGGGGRGQGQGQGRGAGAKPKGSAPKGPRQHPAYAEAHSGKPRRRSGGGGGGGRGRSSNAA